MAYQAVTFAAGEVLTAAKMNILASNDASFNDGTGIGNGVIQARSLNLPYSTAEQNTGMKWIDGETIYKKTISLGRIPNSTGQSVAHGISNFGVALKIEAFMHDSGGSTTYPIPFVSKDTLGTNVEICVNVNSVIVTTGSSLWYNAGLTGYATIYYTKSS